jgi:hypothetical protein
VLYTQDKVGADFKLDKNYDLAVSSYGDILYTQGSETIVSALIRRISTDLNSYVKYVRVGSTVYRLNNQYGSSLMLLLSAPINTTSRIKETIERAARLDGRVEIHDVRLQTSVQGRSVEQGRVNVDLSFTIKPEYLDFYNDRLQQVTLSNLV